MNGCSTPNGEHVRWPSNNNNARDFYFLEQNVGSVSTSETARRLELMGDINIVNILELLIDGPVRAELATSGMDRAALRPLELGSERKYRYSLAVTRGTRALGSKALTWWPLAAEVAASMANFSAVVAGAVYFGRERELGRAALVAYTTPTADANT